MSQAESAPEGSRLLRVLNRIASVGNRLPDPITLFAILAGVVVIASALGAGISEQVAQRDGSVATKPVRSLLSSAGVRWMFDSAVTNFTGFAPLGSVLTVMIGIGVAERSGLVSAALRALVQSVPKSLVTAAVVFAGVMSSMAADAGYVVLTPLGAVLFVGLGRHPIAGLAAAFAGVSGGYSANLFITGLDPLLAGLTQEAARTIDPEYRVTSIANYYFMLGSTALITVVGTLVTSRIVEPMLGPYEGEHQDEPETSGAAAETRALRLSALAATITVALIALLVAFPDAPLRDAVKPGRPAVEALGTFFGAIEILIAIAFFIPGVVYGLATGSVKNDKDVARMTSETMATMGAYIALAFVAAQFVAYFNWTNLGAVSAVKGAGVLKAAGLSGLPLLLAFLVVSSTMNLFVGSASAKWAFMAPVFVPMRMMMGFSPEAVQATYRVGDSTTNIISPLMPYLPIIIVFAQKYDPRAGLGTMIAAMLPYSIAFGLCWTGLLAVWIGFDFPLGPGVSSSYSFTE